MNHYNAAGIEVTEPTAAQIESAILLGTTTTQICDVGSMPENDGVSVQNNGSVVVYLGSSTVTADATSTGGVQVAAGATVTVPTTGAESVEL